MSPTTSSFQIQTIYQSTIGHSENQKKNEPHLGPSQLGRPFPRGLTRPATGSKKNANASINPQNISKHLIFPFQNHPKKSNKTASVCRLSFCVELFVPGLVALSYRTETSSRRVVECLATRHEREIRTQLQMHTKNAKSSIHLKVPCFAFRMNNHPQEWTTGRLLKVFLPSFEIEIPC